MPLDTASPRLPALVLLLGSGGLLLGALFFQYVIGLAPCELCLLQRWPHGAVIALSLLCLLAGRGRAQYGTLVTLCGLILLAGAGIALFHVGVEHHWWAGTAECGATNTASTLDALKAQILSSPVVRCDQPAWSLFGITMAGYNALISLALSAFALRHGLRALMPVRRPA